MSPTTFRELLPADAEVGHGFEAVALVLERNGWYPRKRNGSSAIAYWPDGQRGRQYLLTFNFCLVPQRIARLAEHTGIDELLSLIENKVEQ